MPRKSAAVLPPKPLSQEELEAEHTKHLRVVRRAEPVHRGRLRNATGVPSGDAPTGEILDIVSDAIEVNADALEWAYGERGNALTARQWAEIVVRAIRYGLPTDEYEGDGFHIREDDNLGEAPECVDCQAEE
jgi:hypothetical protein